MRNDLFLTALARMGLLQPGERPAITPLAGGVSSDIVRVDLASGPICVKRALPKLKVEADWQAPVERNRYEVQWMRVAAGINPAAVPRILGEDPETGMFAMQFLDSSRYPVWKAQLRDGEISADTARDVGRRVAAFHGRTAGDTAVALTFATDHIFFPIRLEPYLAATADKHSDCAERLRSLMRVTGATRKALVHGDISPKNILAGPDGPVFLDAECAWYGDPAFDLAFCLNHLLLKCVWRPRWQARYLVCFDAFAQTYLAAVTWESRTDIETRTAHLLPGLFLGRVDGKSPVEYINTEEERDRVRRVARALLARPVDKLSDVRLAWQREIATWNK
ncbi:MAG TPA: aminoglycoside phosphotransferase family protein [Burkholderiales bacterium]|jgi:tRNA A-37 threonylcarbamoyl transferase component Bud32|nr:aminoglycoside phosphotransferase family protein [Burkholderiales bacterium]